MEMMKRTLHDLAFNNQLSLIALKICRGLMEGWLIFNFYTKLIELPLNSYDEKFLYKTFTLTPLTKIV
jgi:hypothetical protein